LLVALPWARLEHPSIQLGLLKAILDARGIRSKQLHLYLKFIEHLAALDSTLGPADYDDVATKYFIGDWIFSVPPFGSPSANEDGYLAYLREEGESEAFIAKCALMRQAVPSFLEAAADEILSFSPDVIGFTTTFGQSVSSLVMAKVLKQRNSHLQIILGGANCDGDMGEALHRNFPWVDIVVRGDAEPVFGDLVESLLAGRVPKAAPGLCLRSGPDSSVEPLPEHFAAAKDARSHVDYDEYFSRLKSSPFAADISPRVSIPFESSRGCWWGQKHHCTFCGLNGSAMQFRAMDPENVLDELTYLAQRYERLDFNATDNIIDRRLFETLIPALASSNHDFHIFYEVKANLRKAELAGLHAAGIREIQPGIESLSSSVLRRMRKGTTALQNIRLLKWCAAYGIKVHWNIIHGLPGDTSAEYAEMARTARNCFHFDAPNLIPLSVERFSPYHNEPDAFGIEVLGAKAHYRFAYPLEAAELDKIAYSFEHRLVSQPDAEEGLSLLREVVADWQSAEASAGVGSLKFYRGPGFSIIKDRRPGRAPSDFRLGAAESLVYEACDEGVSVAVLSAKLAGRGDVAAATGRVQAFLASLLDAGLVFREGNRYLSLAVEASPRSADRDSIKDGAPHRVVTLNQIGVVVGAG
jgi:ribosomal peptide maturation radical SAM protein 1